MFNEILLSPGTRMLAYALLSVVAIAVSLVISSGIRLNKGAGVNSPLILVAVGFVLDAVAAAMIALGYYGQETLGAWAPVVLVLALLVQLSGWAWWRAIIKGLVK